MARKRKPDAKEAALAETRTLNPRTTERRLRALPSRVGMYFVLALCLFPGLGYRKVWAKLTATVRGRKTPSDKALRDSASPPRRGADAGAV